jgi:hybrid cluster-associated redox disulfide protein
MIKVIGPRMTNVIESSYYMIYHRRQEREKNGKEDRMTTKKIYTKDSLIGDVIKENPEATKVIEKYFGNGCFTCPGIRVESIGFGSMMHNVDAGKVVKELNELEG